MPCASAFTKALAHAALLGTTVPWSNWRVALVAESAIKDGTTIDQLMPVLEQQEAGGWTMHDYVAPDPEHVPPIAESLPYMALSSSPIWTNHEDHTVTFAAIVFVGTNAAGKQEVLFWEVLANAITLQRERHVHIDRV